MKLLLMGAQGSGKGTAAEKLSVIYNIPTISIGDLFRAVVKSGSDLGKQLKKIMDAGNLVSDELTLQILNARLAEDDCKGGYMLDGFPRTIEQAYLLSGLISFRMHCLDLLAVQGILKSLLQHHSSKASIIRCSKVFFIVQLSYPFVTTGKTVALTR